MSKETEYTLDKANNCSGISRNTANESRSFDMLVKQKGRRLLGVASGGVAGGLTGMGVLGGLCFLVLGPAGIATASMWGLGFGGLGGAYLGNKLATKVNESIAEDNKENKKLLK